MISILFHDEAIRAGSILEAFVDIHGSFSDNREVKRKWVERSEILRGG